MSNLISIMPPALTELKRIAQEEGKDLRVRIAFLGGGCSGYQIDMHFTKFPHDEEHDLVFEMDGIEFIIDEKSAALIKGATLDYGGGLLDRKFKWDFPNATGGCGCGLSFSF